MSKESHPKQSLPLEQQMSELRRYGLVVPGIYGGRYGEKSPLSFSDQPGEERPVEAIVVWSMVGGQQVAETMYRPARQKRKRNV